MLPGRPDGIDNPDASAGFERRSEVIKEAVRLCDFVIHVHDESRCLGQKRQLFGLQVTPQVTGSRPEMTEDGFCGLAGSPAARKQAERVLRLPSGSPPWPRPPLAGLAHGQARLRRATGPNRYRLESIYYTNRPRRFVVNCGDDSATSFGDMCSNLFQGERLAAVNAFAAH
jgi:hypothetical protein